MTGIEVLRRQHERLLEALDELEVTVDDHARVRLLAHIGQRLKAHAAVEDEIFYPTVEQVEDPKVAGAVADALEAHQAIDALLDEMIGAEISPAKVRILGDLARRHFEAEETTLFPVAQRLADPDRAQLERDIDDYLEEFGDGAGDTLPAG
jgi:hemerythrin-like domain-containing protein